MSSLLERKMGSGLIGFGMELTTLHLGSLIDFSLVQVGLSIVRRVIILLIIILETAATGEEFPLAAGLGNRKRHPGRSNRVPKRRFPVAWKKFQKIRFEDSSLQMQARRNEIAPGGISILSLFEVCRGPTKF